MSLKLAVLASGSGTNFQAMADAVRRGVLDADIRIVICNRPGAKVIDRAKADYRSTHKVGVQSCKVYVKPEEDAAYYVINKVSGKLDL